MADSVYNIVINANAQPIVRVTSNVNALNRSIQNLGRQSGGNALQRSFQNVQQSAQNAQNAVSRVASSLGAAGTAALSVGASITRGIITPLQRAIGLAGRLGGSIRNAGRAAMGGFGAIAKGLAVGTTVLGIGAIKEAVAWQEQMEKINTIARYRTPEAFKKASQGIQDLSREYGISLDDMASAQYEFLSAGIGLFKTLENPTPVADVEQTKRAMEAAAKFSIASLASQTESVTLLSFALNAYNLNQKEVNEETAKAAGLFDYNAKGAKVYASSMGQAADVIGDMFSKAVEIGVVKGPEIARSFSTVAASAKMAGIGINEIAAAYASQTVRGVSAARVTVSMNRAILDLVRPGKALQELMKQTGRNYAKMAETEGIHVALQQMRMDAKAAGVEYGTLFKRQEGLRFALNITQDDIDDAAGNFRLYEIVLKQVNEASKGVGNSADQMEKRMHTVAREASRVQIAFKILKETIGRPFLEPLQKLLATIVDIEVALYEWARSDFGQKFIAQMGPVIGFTALLVSLTAGMQGLLVVFTRIAPMMGMTATNLRPLAIMLGQLVMPLAIIIGLLGSFKFLVENNIRGFGVFTENLNDMKRLFGGIVTVFQTAAQGIRDVWDAISHGGNVDVAVARALDQVGQAVENLGPNLEKVLRFVASFALSVGQAIAGALAKAIPAIVNWVGSVVQALLPRLAYLAGVFVKWASEMIPKVIAALGDFAGSIVRWLGEVIPQVAAILGLIIRAFIDWAKKAVPVILKNLGDFASQIGDWLSRAVPVVVANLRELTNTFIDWAKSVAPTILKWLGDTASGIWAWIGRNGPIILGALASWTGAFIDWAASLLPTILAKLADFANGVFMALTSFGNDDGPVGSAMSGAGDQLTKWIGDRLPAAIDALSNWIGQLAQWIVTVGIPRFVATMAKLAGELLGALDDYLSKEDPNKIAEALLKLLTAGVVIVAVMNAGTILAEVFAIAFNTGKLLISGLVSLFGQLVIALAPSAALTGTGLGATMGLAFAAAAAAAIIAAPVAVLAVAIKISSDINQQAEDLKAQTIDFTKVASTAELENSIKGVTEEMNKLPGNAFDARNKVVEIINIMQQEVNDRKMGLKIDPKAFDNSGVFTDGYTSILAQAKAGANKAGPELKSVSQQMADNFNAGFNSQTAGIQTFDVSKILQEDKWKASAENISATVSQSFADMEAAIATSTASIASGLDKYDSWDEKHKPKPGAKTPKFTSDADRLKAIKVQIDRARKDLRAAVKAQDTTAQIEIQGILDKLGVQRTALENAGKVAGQAATNAATETAKLNAAVTTVGGTVGTTVTEASKAPAKAVAMSARELAKFKRLRTQWAAEQARLKKLGEEPIDWNEWVKGRVKDKNLPKFQFPEPTINGVPASDYYATLKAGIPNATVTPIPQAQQDAAIQSYRNVAAGAEAAMDGINARAQAAAAVTASSLSTITTTANDVGSRLPSALAAGITAGANSGAIGIAVSVLAGAVNGALNAIVGVATGLGTAATYAFAAGMTTPAAITALQTAARTMVGKANEVVALLNWKSYGYTLVATFAAGMMKALFLVRAASLAVAVAAAHNTEHKSPAKHGPLRNVPAWGREMTHQFALGMSRGIPDVASASGMMAAAAAGGLQGPFGLGGGAREIAPIGATTMGAGAGQGRDEGLLRIAVGEMRVQSRLMAQLVAQEPTAASPQSARGELAKQAYLMPGGRL